MKHLKIIFIFVFLVLFSHYSYSLSLGSLVKNDYVKIIKGGSGKFELLFWNRESVAYEVELIPEKSQKFSVFIEPEKFVIDRFTGSESINLPDDSLRAIPVSIIVASDDKGKHNITIIARTKPSGEIAFSQERIIKLTAEVDENISIAERSTEKSAKSKTPSNSEKETASIVEIIEKNYIIFAIIIIILISLAIYKIA